MRTVFVASLAFLLSCKINPGIPDTTISDTANKPVLAIKEANISANDNSKDTGLISCPWAIDFDKKTKTKNSAFKQENLNVDTIIIGLNQLHSNIKLEKVKFGGDTFFTKIKDSEYLTERIGTYGAFAYIADVVINLTSLKDINFVKIDFEDGSHLSPGTWSKKEYDNYKETKS